MDIQKLKRIVEGALLAAHQPLTIEQLERLFAEGEARPTRAELREALGLIEAECEGRGFELREVASGWRFQVRQELAPWVGRLWEEKPPRYSRAFLETLALIAYRQPITRAEIEEVRGVAVSSNIIKTLQEREWIRVVGHKDVPGKPAMFGTTRAFLDYFNLKSLDELPTLAELRDLDQIHPELGFGAEQPPGEEAEAANDADPTAQTAENPVVAELVENGEVVTVEALAAEARAAAEEAEQALEESQALIGDAEQALREGQDEVPTEEIPRPQAEKAEEETPGEAGDERAQQAEGPRSRRPGDEDEPGEGPPEGETRH